LLVHPRKNWFTKIGTKLTIGFLSIAIIGGVIGYMGFSGSQNIIDTYNIIADETAPEIAALGKIGLLSQQLQSAAVSFVLINAELNVSGESAIAVVEELKEFEETNEKLDVAILQLSILADDKTLQEITDSKTELYNTALALIDGKKEGKTGQPIFELKEEMENAAMGFEKIINDHIAKAEEELLSQGKIADELATNTTNLILLVSTTGIISAVILGSVISRMISKPVKNLEIAAKKMAKGNFDVNVQATSNDEIGEFARLFGSMAKNIKQADKQKDEFSSMVTHELRTPLMPILGWCDILKRGDVLGPISPDQYHAIDKISSNAVKLTSLISDLLDVRKLDFKMMKFSYEDINIYDFMNDIYLDIKSLIGSRKIHLVNSTKQNIVVKSDKGRLGQVLNNLIYNAIDFVHEDTGRIEINAQLDNSEILFYVKDNGIGISPETQKNLFKKFYQTDTSPARKHGGSGLGLSICKGIVEGLGGRIWLESKVGHGTTFYFSVPISSI